mgnify:CR=1 FL=1
MAKRLSKAMIAKLPKAYHNYFKDDVVSFYEVKDFLGDIHIEMIDKHGEKSSMSKRRFDEMYIKM